MKLKAVFLKVYNNLSLYRKFLITFVVISILPVLILQSVSFITVNHLMKRQIDDFTLLHLEQSYDAVDNLFNNYNNLILKITRDTTIVENLKTVNDWGPQYPLSVHNIRNALGENTYDAKGVLGVAIISNNNQIIFLDQITHSYQISFCIDTESIFSHPAYTEALASDTVEYTGGGLRTHPQFGSKSVVYISHRIMDYQNPDTTPAGVVVFTLDEAYLENAYLKKDTNWNTSFITNQAGDILSFPRKEYLGKNIFATTDSTDFNTATQLFAKEAGVINSTSLITNYLVNKEKDLVIVDVLDGGYLLGPLWSLLILIIGVGIFAVIFALLVIQYTSQNMNRKVEAIIDTMEQTNRGDLSARTPDLGSDEFGVIAGQYNATITEMEALNERENQMAEAMRVAEIQALESQINPHFIYNTLDSINWIAISHKEYEISHMLRNLGSILRYTVHNSNQVVPLQEELDFLKEYLVLQQQRYQYSFTSVINVEEGLEALKIHKILIQPLIENSLIHGFPHTEQDKLWLTIYKKNSELMIQVKDNGIGISEKTMNELNSYSYESGTIANSIGIRNVISRIQMYYSGKGRFYIEKSSTGGTKITITLPIEEGTR